MGAALGVAAIGCGGSATDPPSDGPDAATGFSDDDMLARCSGQGPADPAQLLAHIDTFVVLCMENRSFDHYLGSLRLLENRMDIDGLTGAETNVSESGVVVPVHLLQNFTPSDPPHNWKAAHAQWNQGANDGFVRAHAGASERDVMGYHVRSQLPMLYALADAGAICNRWFSSLLGPTWPNRWYLHGATSKGRKTNAPMLGSFRSIFQLLDDAGISHTNYFHDVAWATGAYYKFSGLDGIEKYFQAAQNGTLPRFCMIDPKYTGSGANDDHPDHDIRLGQALIGSVFSALAQSPQWERSLFILTYDENGGFYDHVAPPTTEDSREEFRQLGFRVPSIVAGPTVRRGCAIDTTFEHTSVIATLTRRFGLEVMNERVTAANDLSSCIDPGAINNPHPPPHLPTLDISLRELKSRPPAHTHSEIVQSMDELSLPGHLDRRGRDLEVSRAWLEHAAALGVVRLVDQ